MYNQSLSRMLMVIAASKRTGCCIWRGYQATTVKPKSSKQRKLFRSFTFFHIFPTFSTCFHILCARVSDLGPRSRSRIQGGTQRSSRVWSTTVLEIQRRCQCPGSRVSRSISNLSNLKERAQGKIQGSRIQRIKRWAKPGKERKEL